MGTVGDWDEVMRGRLGMDSKFAGMDGELVPVQISNPHATVECNATIFKLFQAVDYILTSCSIGS